MATRARFRGFSVLLMAIAVMSPLLKATPASATEEAPPTLTAVELLTTMPISLGGTPAVRVSLSNGADSVRLVYTDESTQATQVLEWAGTPAPGPLEAVADDVVDEGYFAGVHSLREVLIDYDGGAKSLRYGRDGSITHKDGSPAAAALEQPVPNLSGLDFTVDDSATELETNVMLAEPSIIGVPLTSFHLGVDPGLWSEPLTGYTTEWLAKTGAVYSDRPTVVFQQWDVGVIISARVSWAKAGFRPVQFTTGQLGPLQYGGDARRLLGQMS